MMRSTLAHCHQQAVGGGDGTHGLRCVGAVEFVSVKDFLHMGEEEGPDEAVSVAGVQEPRLCVQTILGACFGTFLGGSCAVVLSQQQQAGWV